MNTKEKEDQQKYLADKIEELHNPVAKSAKGLCRKILRYKGESDKKKLIKTRAIFKVQTCRKSECANLFSLI